MFKGDMFIVDLRAFRNKPPDAGEIGVYKRDGTYFVKRVIAVGGDVISSEDGVVAVNEKQLQEPFAHHSHDSDPPGWANNFGPIKVPPGKIFVMGDNRDVSLDSRSEEVGFIDLKEVAGRPLYNYRPLNVRVGKDIR